MPNETIGRVLFILLVIAVWTWALCTCTFWFYFAWGLITSGKLVAKLLRRVREVSEQTFDELHRGNINPAFEIVPYAVLNSSRFNAFVKSEELNEYSDIKMTKAEWQKATEHVQRDLIIWCALFSIGLIILAALCALIASGTLR